MKTYTLEEAERRSVSALFDEAMADDAVVLVRGEQRLVLWPETRVPSDYLEEMQREDDALWHAAAEESLKATEQAVRDIIPER